MTQFTQLSEGYVVGVWDACKQKLYGDDSCPSQLQSLAKDLQLAGVKEQRDGKLCSSGEEQLVRIFLYAYVCVASPMIVGAWSMAAKLCEDYLFSP